MSPVASRACRAAERMNRAESCKIIIVLNLFMEFDYASFILAVFDNVLIR